LTFCGGVTCQTTISAVVIPTIFNQVFFCRLGLRCISSVVPKSDISVTDFKVENEPILGYLAGSKERADLEVALKKYSSETEDVPIVIGGKEYRTDNVHYQPMVMISIPYKVVQLK
jgi:hypothetical protein